MSKVIMTCGRICSGKTTYAEKLRKEIGAAVLSVDEITLALFGQDTGDMHDTYVERAEKYLYAKSLEIVEVGIDVILDWGFWQKSERDHAREFYRSNGVECEFHFIDVSDEEWNRRLQKRNSAVLAGETDAYYVDEGLAAKFGGMFETPSADEIDIWIKG